MSDLYGVLTAIGALIALLAGAFGLGWKRRAEKKELQDAKEYQRTMDQTLKGSTSDDDAANDAWLRDRAKGKPRGLLHRR